MPMSAATVERIDSFHGSWLKKYCLANRHKPSGMIEYVQNLMIFWSDSRSWLG